MEDFIGRTEKLLALERQAEVEQCEELLSTQMIHDSKRLESKGLCITKLSISHQRIGLYGRHVITFTRRNTKNLPCNRFTAGMCSNEQMIVILMFYTPFFTTIDN